LALASTALALVVALGAWLGSGGSDPNAGRETVAAERRVFASTVAAIGAVKPQIGAEVRVGSRVSGRVRRLRANIGDQVRKGDVIAEIETADFDALIAQRRAEVELAIARLAALDTVSPHEIARAESDVARFEATAKLAAEEAERQQGLLRERVTSKAEADAALERSLVARAQLASARRALDLARGGSPQQRKQAVAEVARARAALQSAEVDRSFTIITSPIDGVIASVATQEGETVAAGLNAPTFVTLVDLRRLQVNAYVDEVDIGKVTVGQPATFTVDAFPARDFEGRVEAIYPTATIQDNVVKYVAALTIANDSAGLLRPEMTTSVRIKLDQRTVLALPTRAIGRVDGRSVVQVSVRGRVETRPVRTGWRDGSWVELLEGIREGERVLLDPLPTDRRDNR
jgi:multidrug efflux pump subunit AcrA (membrane-fusion protein)